MKFEKSENVPIMQTKFMRILMKPFVPMFEKSKPEDFEAVYKKEKEAEKKGIEEKPRESKVMGFAIKIDKKMEKTKPVSLLMEETQGEMALNEKDRKRSLKNIRRQEDKERELKISRSIESDDLHFKKSEEKDIIVGEKGKDLLRGITSTNQVKQQSIKKYMLGGLKDVYE